MKRLILPVIFFLLGAGGVAYSILYLSPTTESGINYTNLAILLVSALLLLAPALGLVVYSLHFGLVKLPTWLKLALKIELPKRNPSLRRGFWIALYIVTAGFLSALRTNSAFNLSLLGIILILIESLYWKKQ